MRTFNSDFNLNTFIHITISFYLNCLYTTEQCLMDNTNLQFAKILLVSISGEKTFPQGCLLK